jgi:hypothetical protein
MGAMSSASGKQPTRCGGRYAGAVVVQRLGQFGIDEAECDRVHGDVELCDFAGLRTGETAGRSLDAA